MKKPPRNTAAENPVWHMMEALDAHSRTGDPTTMVLEQEAAGQRELVDSVVLPTDIRASNNFDGRRILEAAGIKFLDIVEGDRLFQNVELVHGWRKEQTDRAMWSKLVDEKDRERALIFYKAAPYDRCARMSLTKRFGFEFDYSRFEKESVGVSKITDCGNVIYTTEQIFATEDDKLKDISEKACAIATAWLDEHYPDWLNPGAYWD